MENGVSAGIGLRRLGNSLVPVYEEESSRIERGVSPVDWQKMSEMEKALIIARRRIVIQMQNLQTEAEIKKMRQNPKRK